MASDYDPAEFVDSDFQAHKTPQSGTVSTTGTGALRAPTREEVDSRMAEAQQKLAELKRAQEELERERGALEETRRRQVEFQTGRQEMIQNLTRGLGLLEEAEFSARKDAEQMSKAVAGFRDALTRIQTVNEETWTKDNFSVELTRALTAVENARMEWNAARVRFEVLSGQRAEAPGAPASSAAPAVSPLHQHGFVHLCKLGLAFTWPLAVVAVGALVALLVVLLRR